MWYSEFPPVLAWPGEDPRQQTGKRAFLSSPCRGSRCSGSRGVAGESVAALPVQHTSESARLESCSMLTFLTSLWRDDSGQDLAEYALLLALIALVAIAAITLVGTDVKGVFQDIADALPG